MRHIFFLTVLITFLLFPPPIVRAQSSYVLPYPSSMPGTPLYTAHLVWEKIMQYWYFGDKAQFTYNLKQADKYLVEAKTLFEYKQYLLATSALAKSDQYFKNVLIKLRDIKNSSKDTTQEIILIKSASAKHKEVILSVRNMVPREFIWNPEKQQSTTLELENLFNKSVNTREVAL